MKTQAKVTKNPKTGSVFTPNQNLGKDGKIYGYIRMEQDVIDFNGGIISVKKRSSLKTIKLEDFEKVKDFLSEGTILTGNIVRKEQLIPFYEGQPNKQAFINDKDGKQTEKLRDVLHNGQKIWSSDIFTEDMSMQDELLIPYDKYIPEKVEESSEKVEESSEKVEERAIA